MLTERIRKNFRSEEFQEWGSTLSNGKGVI